MQPTDRVGRDVLASLQGMLDGLRIFGEESSPAGEALRPHLAPDSKPGPPPVAPQTLADLERIDVLLAELAESLNRLLRSMPLAQLRATLPEVASRTSTEMEGLLDLCVEAGDYSQDALHRIDYMITMLSCANLSQQRALRKDPTRVSSGVAEACARFARDASLDERDRAAAAARAIRDATMEVLLLDDPAPMVVKMREFKGRLGRVFFDVDVLRCIVHYNLSVANRFHALLEMEREQDEALERTLLALEAFDIVATQDGVNAAAGLPMDSPGLRALEEAIRARLRGEAPRSDAAAAVVANVDLDRLDDEEIRAFVNPVDENTARVLRAAVVVGLALRELPGLSVQLMQLDIDAVQLEHRWVKDLDRVLTHSILSLRRSGKHQQAAQLTHTRMKFLSAA